MPVVAKSVAALRISGGALIPEEITARIGAPPTYSYRKGEVKLLNSGRSVVRKFGMWLLEATPTEPENLNSQIEEIFARLTSDMEVWKALCRDFEVDLYSGLFMEGTNEGLCLSVLTLTALADRGIELGLDVYAPTNDLTPTDPCPCNSGKSYGECCGSKSEA